VKLIKALIIIITVVKIRFNLIFLNKKIDFIKTHIILFAL